MFESRDYVSDYESETNSNLDTNSEISRSDIPPSKDKELWEKPTTARFPAYANAKSVWDAENKRAYNSVVRHHLLNLNAFDRHKKLVNDYLQYYGGSWSDFKRDTSKDKTDVDVIREHGRFLWSEQDEPLTWSERLAKKYWEKLFKEYCLVDLSRYKENKFGMRWRLEKEVISGKGQFACGNVACPAGAERLRSWEVNFVYQERGERRNALVKVRLCPACSDKLNYRYKRRDVTGQRISSEQDKNDTESKRQQETSGDDDDNDHKESAAKRPRNSSDRNDDDNINNNNSDNKNTSDTTDINSVWCKSAQTSQGSGNPSGAANISSTSGNIKTPDDEFDEYFADMLM
ncbi:unnamed protein product [Trichobilharzia szidati]|nr:unnamed protein product [Trichobilharzia szidati]